MSHETRRTAQGVRRLPTVRLDGIDYFIDERLREFRAVRNCDRRIGFNSQMGVNMTQRTAIVGCRACGQEFGVPWTKATTRTWYVRHVTPFSKSPR